MGGATSTAGGPPSGGTSGRGSADPGPGSARYDAIYTGSPWHDDRGNVINAHAAGVVEEDGKYYLIGERHSDTSNAFTAFNAYSSIDLINWKFENEAWIWGRRVS